VTSGALEGRVAIVTGAARGIGKAVAAHFLTLGAAVMLSDVLDDELGETHAEFSAEATCARLAGDVTDPAYCDVLTSRTVAELGRIDVLVNNAGIARWGSFLDHSDSDWYRTLDVDLSAVFLLSKRVARVMVDQGSGGVILSTASNNGHVPEVGVVGYNAAKAGVIAVTKTMAAELAIFGIRANCVSPGHVGPTALAGDGGASAEFLERLTDRIPLGRLGKVEEVAQLYGFLASDASSFITGQSIIIDGGQLSVQ
jgi:NAD(P)-dependent dehydrogenase (short-subunit alcohol dehydrogenase family)